MRRELWYLAVSKWLLQHFWLLRDKESKLTELYDIRSIYAPYLASDLPRSTRSIT